MTVALVAGSINDGGHDLFAFNGFLGFYTRLDNHQFATVFLVECLDVADEAADGFVVVVGEAGFLVPIGIDTDADKVPMGAILA